MQGIEKKNPQALVENSIKKTSRQKRKIRQNLQENQARATPHPVEKKAKQNTKVQPKRTRRKTRKNIPALSVAIHL